MKIRNKITLLFTLIVTIILLVLSISVYYMSLGEIRESFRKRLKSRASNNAQIFGYIRDTSLSMLRRIDETTVPLLPRKSVAIIDTTGRLLYHYTSTDADSLVVNKNRIQDITTRGEIYYREGNRDAVGIYNPGVGRPFVIVVEADDIDGRQRLSELRQVLIFSLLIGMLITLVTGYVFSSQLVRPIRRIILEVNAISSHNISKRLHTGSSKDELNELAKTFNDLLDRLQDSFNIQRRFISNASHELSTPLTSISSQLQVTLQNERNTDEYRRILQSIQEDVEQMRQLTKSLLEIARAGSQGSIELGELRVDELLLKVIGDVKRNYPGYKVHVEMDEFPESEEESLVFGNFDLLYSAIRNIIENGCKYSPDHTSFTHLQFHELQVYITVSNKGDIITEDEIDQIFQPFFRGENASDTKGFGLGLPLAKRIVALHKGTIEVESRIDGTTFRICLPSFAASRRQL